MNKEREGRRENKEREGDRAGRDQSYGRVHHKYSVIFC